MDRQEFASSFKSGVLVQFLVKKRISDSPIGLVTSYNANQRDGVVYVSGLAHPEFMGSGLLVEAVGLLIGYLFDLWPFRKVYLESIDFNVRSFQSALGRALIEEGRLKDHTYHGDRYWDLVTLSVSRERWSSLQPSRAEIGLPDSHTMLANGNGTLSAEDFCEFVLKEIPPPSGLTGITLDHKLVEELGYDSFSVIEIVTLVDDMTGSPDLEWPDQFETIRDIYLWYATCSSGPQND